MIPTLKTIDLVRPLTRALLASLCLFVTTFAFSAAPSSPDSLLIEAILFIGNETTAEHVLSREMQLCAGDPYDAQIAEMDRQRILNLRLFNRVEFQQLPGEKGIVLLVIVSEKWYFFPYPILFIHDRDWDKLSYGAGLIYANFRGRNITLASNLLLGYNPSVSFQYKDPWIHGSQRLAFAVSVNYNRVRNKSILYDDFNEQHFGLSVSLGRRIGFYGSVEVEAGYREVKVPPLQGISLAQDGVDRLPAISFRCRYDQRDYYAFPMKGWFLAGYVQTVHNGGMANYSLAGFDIRRYQPILKGLSFALRGKADLSWGKMPVYDHYFIGYSERVRGHFQQVIEGERCAFASAELRMPLIKTRYFKIGAEDRPWSPYLRDLPFACHATLFYDTGTATFQDQSWTRQHWLAGFGAGVNFQLPYVDLIRFERAWNNTGHGEYIVDMKVWF